MASYSYTFTSGDSVTPTKLNNARTVSDIVNADIKSDAAIAGTKIAPSFGSQTITSSSNDGFRVNANFGSLKGYGADTTTFVGMVQFNKDADVLLTTEQAIPLIFKTNTTERMRIDASGNVGIATSSPAYLLDANGTVNTSDAYRVDGVKVVGNRATGWEAPTGTATRTTFDTTSVTLPLLAQRVKALIDDLTAHGLIGA